MQKREIPLGCKLSGKKHPVIIHLMATIVIILIASIWILFQKCWQALKQARGKTKKPTCDILL